MTRTWKPGEAWTRDEGAPDGPEFDVTIPSSRRGRGPYRLHRDPVTGTILHQPPCEAWANGHKMCRHTTEAVRRAEQPDSGFALAVHELLVTRNQGFNPTAYRDPVLKAWLSDLTAAHNRWMEARGRLGEKTLLDVAHAEWEELSREEQRAEVDAMFTHDLRVTP